MTIVIVITGLFVLLTVAFYFGIYFLAKQKQLGEWGAYLQGIAAMIAALATIIAALKTDDILDKVAEIKNVTQAVRSTNELIKKLSTQMNSLQGQLDDLKSKILKKTSEEATQDIEKAIKTWKTSGNDQRLSKDIYGVLTAIKVPESLVKDDGNPQVKVGVIDSAQAMLLTKKIVQDPMNTKINEIIRKQLEALSQKKELPQSRPASDSNQQRVDIPRPENLEPRGG